MKLRLEQLETELNIKGKKVYVSEEINPTERDKVNEPDKLQMEISQTNHECDMCDYQCEKEITMKKHRSTKHFSQSFNDGGISGNTKKKSTQLHCDECDQVFSTNISLKNHKTQMHVNINRCQTCGNQVNNKDEIEIHIVEKHGAVPDSVSDCKCAGLG